jgi:hypothetical protein
MTFVSGGASTVTSSTLTKRNMLNRLTRFEGIAPAKIQDAIGVAIDHISQDLTGKLEQANA